MAENYDKKPEMNGSVLGLLDMILELDKVKRYLEISPDEEVRKYCEKEEFR